MTVVTNTFAADNPIVASALNQNFNDLLALVGQIGADQLAGGITFDKLTDRYAVSWAHTTIVPGTVFNNAGSQNELLDVSDAASSVANNAYLMDDGSGGEIVVDRIQPPLQNSSIGYLCAIMTYAGAINATNYPYVAYYLNGTTQIGGANINLTSSDTVFLTAKQNPLTDALVPITNGDFIEIRTGLGGVATPALGRSITATFCFKHILNP